MGAELTRLLVPEEADGERLDRFLADNLPQYSREYLQSLIKNGSVTESEAVIKKPAYSIQEGQVFQIEIPEPEPLNLEPENIPIEILYEDADVLVVNKPSGILTHPAGKTITGTLVNALLYHCKDTLSNINGVERPGIVHRLDKDTSGLLMVAKTDIAHRGLQAQLQNRTAKRVYRAIAQGITTSASGRIDAPIGRNPKNRDLMMVSIKGRHAVTNWEVTGSIGKSFSIMKLSLETGRTHQIRVHLSHIGHPIFGDPVYGTGYAKKLKFNSQGQILQAYQLTFEHPVTGKTCQFEIPPDEKFLKAENFLQSL